ncbi:MAG TPA: hypothetical protein VF756_27390 [Thermoanaerobaculia bacterium]
MAKSEDWTANTDLAVPDELAVAMLQARLALFRIDVGSGAVHERFSQALLAFAAGALVAIVGGYEVLAGSNLYGSIVLAATLLVGSLVAGAGQVLVAHYVALVQSGIPHEDALKPALEGLGPQQKLQVIVRVMRELKVTRFWPESWFIEQSLREPDIGKAIAGHLRRVQMMVHVQALFFRVQLLLSVLAAVPVLMGLIRTL